jgi:deazaflavin-dependent oxidoreductase (nitroreductase family)
MPAHPRPVGIRHHARLNPVFRRPDGHLTTATVRRLSRLHSALYRATSGRIGRRLAGNDMLLLTTTRRSTGGPHTVPLLYLRHEGGFVVFASYGGRDGHPSWYRNLVARPKAEVHVERRRIVVTARTTGGEEREALWERAVTAYGGYRGYQARTAREIPVVVLEPG